MGSCFPYYIPIGTIIIRGTVIGAHSSLLISHLQIILVIRHNGGRQQPAAKKRVPSTGTEDIYSIKGEECLHGIVHDDHHPVREWNRLLGACLFIQI